MSDTKHLAVGWDGDYERTYVHPASPGETEGTADVYEADVPAGLWARWEDAQEDADAIYREIVEATGFDEDNGRMEERCPRWQGYVTPGNEWWQVVLAASDDEDAWPRIDVRMRHYDTRKEAEAAIAELPESFTVHNYGRFDEVRRENLRVEHHGYQGRVSECDRCGWPRVGHADQGEVEQSSSGRGQDQT